MRPCLVPMLAFARRIFSHRTGNSAGRISCDLGKCMGTCQAEEVDGQRNCSCAGMCSNIISICKRIVMAQERAQERARSGQRKLVANKFQR
jgi:hypothetical protein